MHDLRRDSRPQKRTRIGMSFMRLETMSLGKNAIATSLVVAALACAGIARAQAPAIVQLPFGSPVAGLAPGSGATQCSSSVDIPTIKGNHYGDGCLATQAVLYAPASTAVDTFGNIYIADYSDLLLRVVYEGGAQVAAAIIAANPSASGLVPQVGHIYTLAGGWTGAITQTGSPKKYYCNGNSTGTIGLDSDGDGCPGAESYMKPRGIALDKDDNVFFTNLAGGQTVRVFLVNAGTATSPTAAAKLVSTLYGPTTLTTAPQTGFVYSVAGTSTAAYKGDGAGALTAQFISIRDIAVDANGNLYLSDDKANTVRVIYNSATVAGLSTSSPLQGDIYTLTGNPNGACAQGTTGSCPSGSGGNNGAAASAGLNAPYTLIVDSNNNLYIADSGNGQLRVIYRAGQVPGLSNPTPGDIYAVAGGGSSTASGNPANQINIALPQSAGVDQQGNLYIADATNKYIWRIEANTAIATQIAGIGPTATAPVIGAYCNGQSSGPQSIDNAADGCPALESAISPSLLLAFDASNNLYETESGNADIRRFSMNDQFAATVAGSSTAQPLAFQLLPAQTLTAENFTLQGGATTEFSDASTNDTCAIGSPLTASTICAFYVAFAPAAAGPRFGSLALSGSSGAAPVALLSGTGTAGIVSVDPGSQLTIGSGLEPSGVGTDAQGQLYISDSLHGQVLRVSTSGGSLDVIMSGLSSPGQVAVDGAGNVYVADRGNNRIAELPAGGSSVVSMGSGLNQPAGVVVDGTGNAYVADTGNKRIVKIEPGGNQQTLSITGLSSPTELACDAAGDLFVADPGAAQLVELAANGTQSTVNLGSTAVTPQGIAVDAAGNLYIADSSSLQVLFYLSGSTAPEVLLTSLESPAGLTIDQNGSVYVADTKLAGALAVNRALGSLNLPITNVNQTTTTPLLVSDTGNASFTFTGTSFANLSGTGAAEFSISPGTTDACALGAPVTAATQCQLTASFLPLQRGSYSATANLVTNAANGAVTGASLNGTGFQLVTTSVSIQVTSPTGNIVYAQPVTISASVSAQAKVGTMTGTLTLTIDGQAQTPQPVGNGSISQTLNLAAGPHVISLGYSGDANYASGSNSTSFTIAPATTNTVLTITPSAPNGQAQLAFQAAVSSPTASGLGGAVSFYSGSTLLSTVSVNAQGVASFTTSTVTYNSYSFTAVYNGNANFNTSTSAAVQPVGTFLPYSTSNSVAIAQGGVASLEITITPLFNLNATLTPSCSNLPANTVCRFLPTTLQMSGSAPQNESILIYTNVASNLAQNEPPAERGLGAPTLFACLCPGILFLIPFRKRLGKFAGVFLLLLVTGAAGAALSGCGTTSVPLGQPTPAGTSTITVTFTGPNNVTQSSTYTLVVNP